MNSRNLDPSLLIPNLAVLLFLAVGIINDKAPLISSRPAGGPFEAAQPAERKTAARFWQDPLDVSPPAINAPAPSTLGLFNAVVLRAQETKQKARAEREQSDAPDPNLKARVLILPVLLKGQGLSRGSRGTPPYA
ncbi:MAG: hypothetical protein QM760_14180 [Nibricoccus sp.]